MSTAAKPQESVNAMFEEAMKCYEQALQTGIQLQEESVKLWKDLLKQAGTPEDFQKKLEEMTADAFPEARQKMESFLEEFLDKSKTSMDLFTKSLQVYQSKSIAEGTTRMQDLLESSLTALRTNVHTILNTNAKVMESWTDLVDKTKPVGKK